MKCLKDIDSKTTGIFAAGVLFGTAGIKLLTSSDAKKLYTKCTAAVLRAKECVMDIVSKAQDNAEDIYAEAKHINEERSETENFYDECDEECCCDDKVDKAETKDTEE